MDNTVPWYKFQEEICDYFESIGASAHTNVSVQGVRTSHDIDVLVKTKFLGEDLIWIVEAKKWKKRVNKLQVLALRTIVDDLGADRGFIISEAGFQSGAYEAAESSNVKLKTFAQLKIDTRELVEAEILKSYKKRLDLIEVRYYSHSKMTRRKYGLKCGLAPTSPIYFNIGCLISTAQSAIISAEKRKYPINLDTALVEKMGELGASNFQQLINWLNVNLNHLDEKILEAEEKMTQNGDFSPKIRFKNKTKQTLDKLNAELSYIMHTGDEEGKSIDEIRHEMTEIWKNI